MSVSPIIGSGCYVDPTASIVGDVLLADGCSVWCHAVLRGDENRITIGRGSNVQDGCVIHVDADHGCVLGEDVTIGHCAVVHGATVGDRVIVGMNATVLSGARIGRGSIVGAGAVVTPGADIPEHSMVLGVPGKVVRTDPAFEQAALRNAEEYHRLRDGHLAGAFGRYVA